MKRQSYPCEDFTKGVAIPINTMGMDYLKQALDKAVEEEDYELASHLRDEIKLRMNNSE